MITASTTSQKIKRKKSYSIIFPQNFPHIVIPPPPRFFLGKKKGNKQLYNLTQKNLIKSSYKKNEIQIFKQPFMLLSTH
jgi:hypothetical protein